MTGDDIKHGTCGGYQQHRKRGTEPCPKCRAACAAYARERRKNAEVRGEEKRQAAARARAYVRLSHAYPTLYRALYEEELRRTT